MVNIGDTFLIPTPPDFATEHLFIVVISINKDEVLIVNITTKTDNSDLSCILTTKDHEFIYHDSVINYRDATKTSTKLLEANLENKKINTHQPCSKALLEKIVKGATNSEHLPDEFKQYFSANLSW